MLISTNWQNEDDLLPNPEMLNRFKIFVKDKHRNHRNESTYILLIMRWARSTGWKRWQGVRYSFSKAWIILMTNVSFLTVSSMHLLYDHYGRCAQKSDKIKIVKKLSFSLQRLNPLLSKMAGCWKCVCWFESDRLKHHSCIPKEPTIFTIALLPLAWP